jgi:hypothetical protein
LAGRRGPNRTFVDKSQRLPQPSVQACRNDRVNGGVAMTILRRTLTALLSAALLAPGVAGAAPATDYTDQWWTPVESGWGAAVLQQGETLLVGLFVYGGDARPTWFTTATTFKAGAPAGHETFAGDLFQTTGPYYGGAWNAGAVAYRRVGALTFDATAPNAATLSYTVDGTLVTKSVTRQTWRYENLTGVYETVWNTTCGNPSPFDWYVTRTVIRHGADNTVTMVVTCPLCFTDFRHELRGIYTQSGHLGRIAAELVATGTGSITAAEITKTAVGFTARLTGELAISGQTCRITNGTIAASLR